MAGNDREEISFYSRALEITPEDASLIENYIGTKLCDSRKLSDGSFNVSVDISSKETSTKLLEIFGKIGIFDKTDVFISLLPKNDSGIKKIPDHVRNFIELSNCDVLISYTFLMDDPN